MVSIQTCDICDKKVAIGIKAMVDGLILDVCEDCIKYGKKIEVTNIEKIMRHCRLIECKWIE
jgi:ribosome-binding protein aMBF1 (putative translation factor)